MESTMLNNDFKKRSFVSAAKIQFIIFLRILFTFFNTKKSDKNQRQLVINKIGFLWGSKIVKTKLRALNFQRLKIILTANYTD